MPSPFARTGLLDPSTPAGALAWGALLLLLASLAALLVRRGARRVERGLSDVTLLQFASVLAQLLVYLLALVLFAHLVPPLRAFGTALLAGASVASVVVGLAAQDTLGNVVAGVSLVLSRTVRVGDTIRLYCPVGVIDAQVRAISLAFTTLADPDGNEVVVPNSVMMSSAIVRVTRPPSAPTSTTATGPGAGAA